MGWGNLGIAMGAGVDQMNKERQLDRLDDIQRREISNANSKQRLNEAQLERYNREDDTARTKTSAMENTSNLVNFAGDMDQARQSGELRKMYGDLDARQTSGELTQDEAQGARSAYDKYSGQAIPNMVSAEMARAGDPKGGMATRDEMVKQTKKALMDKAMSHVRTGDYQGMADFFSNNANYNDGFSHEFAGKTQGQDGREAVSFVMRNKDGKVNGRSTVATDDLPGFLESGIDGSKGIEWMRAKAAQQRGEGSIDERVRHNTAMEGIAQQRVDKAPAGMSAAQERSNLQIEASRRKLATLDPSDIKKRTAKFTDTGRDNPSYDGDIAAHTKFAARRKIGADDWFDQQNGLNGQQPTQAAQPQPQPPANRFASDPAMKGFRPGKQTDKGTEVFNAAGKLVGHYR